MIQPHSDPIYPCCFTYTQFSQEETTMSEVNDEASYIEQNFMLDMGRAFALKKETPFLDRKP